MNRIPTPSDDRSAPDGAAAPADPGASRALRERIHVVLVEPGNMLNVGAVARAMSNMGFANLHVVAPPRWDAEAGETAACWAAPLLHAAHRHDTLDDALAPMQHVAGFTARHGRNRPVHLILPDWATALPETPGDVALLFGPEDHGLRTEHLTHCRWLVRIPSQEANPSFNLSQAVILALYELTRAAPPPVPELPRQLPRLEDFYQLDKLVQDALTRAGFLHADTPEPVPDVIRHLLRRIDPDTRDMQVLLGMFSKLNRALAGRVPIHELPADGRAPKRHGVDAKGD